MFYTQVFQSIWTKSALLTSVSIGNGRLNRPFENMGNSGHFKLFKKDFGRKTFIYLNALRVTAGTDATSFAPNSGGILFKAKEDEERLREKYTDILMEDTGMSKEDLEEGILDKSKVKSN